MVLISVLLLPSLASTFDQVYIRFSLFDFVYAHTRTDMHRDRRANPSSHATHRLLYTTHFSSCSCHHPRREAPQADASVPRARGNLFGREEVEVEALHELGVEVAAPGLGGHGLL